MNSLLIAAIACSVGFADVGKPLAIDAAAVESLARQILVDCLPQKFEEKKDWDQKTVREDVSLRFKGIKPKIETGKKLVNHGLWKWYRIQLIEPQKRLGFNVSDVRILPGDRTAFKTRLAVPMHVEIVLERWTYGVKLMGFTSEADAVAVVALDCELRTDIDSSGWIPTMTLAPKVVGASLEVKDLRLTKIGSLPKTLVKELSHEAKNIANKVLKKHEGKIVEKYNSAITKKHPDGKIKLSPLQGLK